MYSKHPVFEEPAHTDARIWRYQRLDRFGDLLNRQALFFCRVDKLGDKFEASYPKRHRDREKAWEAEWAAHQIPESVTKRMKELDYAFRMATRRCVVVNCWHLNDYESAAMCSIYSDLEKGVAIQSTFSKLVKCLEHNTEDAVCIGRVKYIDYNKESFPFGNFFFPYVYKRKSFEYEQELRAAILKFPINDHEELDRSMDPYGAQNGKYVHVDLDTLIENVYVSPAAGNNLRDKVESILKKHGLQKEVIWSDQATDPLY